jgi:hypothetical protein
MWRSGRWGILKAAAVGMLLGLPVGCVSGAILDALPRPADIYAQDSAYGLWGAVMGLIFGPMVLIAIRAIVNSRSL